MYNRICFKKTHQLLGMGLGTMAHPLPSLCHVTSSYCARAVLSSVMVAMVVVQHVMAGTYTGMGFTLVWVWVWVNSAVGYPA